MVQWRLSGRFLLRIAARVVVGTSTHVGDRSSVRPMLRFREIAAAASRLRTSLPHEVTLFWDGGCPLCRREIAYYKFLDHEKRVNWINIEAEPERLAPHGVEPEAAMEFIHGIDKSGQLVKGVPAFIAVWEVLPYWNVLPPLIRTFPFAMPLVDAAYAWWAKRRLGISAAFRRLEEGSACRTK